MVILGRKPRVEYSGGIYHVIQRGNNREYIFEEESEKEFWLDQIRKMKTGMEYKVYGYVIMNNHYHLLLQTLGESLQKIMHRLNTRYSKYYNYRRDRTGHVFQGRYKAYLIEDERYFLSLLKYVHNNPVRAKLCKTAADYKWSSDRYYRNNIKGLVDIDFALDALSPNRKEAVEIYCDLIDKTDDKSENTFVTNKRSQKKRNSEEKVHKPTLDEILKETGLDNEEFHLIKMGSRRRILTKYKLCYIQEAIKMQYTLKEIGENINISEAAVADILKRHG